jgi:hypothetical protein
MRLAALSLGVATGDQIVVIERPGVVRCLGLQMLVMAVFDVFKRLTAKSA